jgi:NADH-quinone oxidoreductase subunit F
MLGSAGLIVMDETTCMVWAAKNLLYFYRHESCGKCTPCREGGDWLFKLLSKIERGDGEMRDLDLLLSVAGNIAGKTLCAFGDAAATPVLTTVKTFRAEYEAHIHEGRCTLPASWRATSPVLAAH